MTWQGPCPPPPYPAKLQTPLVPPSGVSFCKAQFQKSWDAWKTRVKRTRGLERYKHVENCQGESQQIQKDQVAFYEAERHCMSRRANRLVPSAVRTGSNGRVLCQTHGSS